MVNKITVKFLYNIFYSMWDDFLKILIKYISEISIWKTNFEKLLNAAHYYSIFLLRISDRKGVESILNSWKCLSKNWFATHIKQITELNSSE